jgi:acetyl esterase/lipase
VRRRLCNLTITAALSLLATTSGIASFGSAALARTKDRDQQQTTHSFTVESDVVWWRTIDGGALTLDAYVPEGGGRHRPAVVLVHGGAWQGGDKRDFAPQGAALAAAGYVAISVNYRLAPTHPFPAAIDDVEAAVAWLRAPAQVRHYGIDPTRIGALGGSAGGHLAAMLGTTGTGPLDTKSRVAVVVTWSGLNDLAAVQTPGFGIELFGCASRACPETAAAASPITYVDASDAPMLLVDAANDPITHLDQVTEMANRLSAAGVDHEVLIVPGSGHSTQLAPAAWDATIAYLARYLTKS